MNNKILSLGFSAAVVLAAASSAQAKETIRIGEVSWDASLAIENVLKVVMEENLDVDVEIIAADQSAIWAAMDKGKGAIDVHPDVWTSAQAEPWQKFVVAGSKESIKSNKTPYNGTEGLFITGYMQDTYDIRSVQDLAKPEIAKLFDSDGDGKGDYWPGAPGWGAVKLNQIKAKSYGFDKYFEPLIVSDSVIKAQLKNAVRRKQGILFFSWTPESIHSAYDLRQLEEPEFTGYASDNKKDHPLYNPNGCYNFVDTENWLEESSITCNAPSTEVHIAYSGKLEKRAPQVARFLSNVALDAKVVSRWIYNIAEQGQDPYYMAKEWVYQNPDVVKGWLK
ncbi:ABC transporter substrate-binding protein [Marinobacterium arenosum]|uniref:ABC transporter substrate-binding protein n=1 Tax=Marinobacterium arenosum TaxID=2862496 RepID=UPI001C95F8FF|nr:glycine betaine ABC transporter substrate-binding protein [Marinobacterium arenosum]MBY4675368.1 hypothetical protein [Marinobacterium arenosum]